MVSTQPPEATTTAQPVLEIRGLVKRFRSIIAVDGVDLVIQPGEFVGLIGPNGAGKTTTMRCISGELAPDEGTLKVGGVSVIDAPIKARAQLGYVPQELELYRYLTGEEFLRFVADGRGVPEGRQDRRLEELLTLTELTEARHRIIREYSGGMARKIAIAAALIARPPLLLLDESFVGLDPESTFALRQHLVEYCQQGGAVVLSSHILDMVERTCDRVVVLARGQVQRDLDTEALQATLGPGKAHATLTELYLETTQKPTP
ncbi:MAG: ABC transporter ATP-binding protein [Myxococcota bacterium]